MTTEMQISSLLGYLPEPTKNRLNGKSYEGFQETLAALQASQAQRVAGFFSFQGPQWVHLSPWVSSN